jgi:hypothetical protein
MNTLSMEKSTAARLIGPKQDAIRHLQLALNRGQEIKNFRIRNGEELDKGRGLKLEWIQDNTDLLHRLFDNPSVADFCNDWVGKIFPEYAEFGNFVEQFYDELDYRLNRLRAVLERIEALPDPGPLQSADPNAPTMVSEAQDATAPPAPAVNQTVSPTASDSAPAPASAPEPASAPPHAAAPAPAPAPPSAPAENPTKYASSPTPVKERHAMSASAIQILFLSQGAGGPAGEAIVQFMQQLALPVVCADLNNGVVESLEGRTDMSFVIVMNTAPAGAANVTAGGANVTAAGTDAPAAVNDQVLFKLGYCAGKFGLKRMCMMGSAAHGEISDAHGIAHVPVDAGGGWQLQLARQMRRAGLDIDLNKLA